jgi:TPR repeat protein
MIIDDTEEDDRMTPEDRLVFSQAVERQKRVYRLHEQAEQGDKNALLRLVSMAKWGDENAHDLLWKLIAAGNEDAEQCYIKIAAEGSVRAQFNIASMLRGRGGPDCAKKAFWWAELSAAQGFSRAQAFLGDIYYSSESRYNDNLENARSNYKKTKDAYYLEKEKQIMESGYIKQDLELVFQWFTLAAAAKKSSVYSQYMLGNMYEHGEGCDKNMRTAVYWYKQVLSAYQYKEENEFQRYDFWNDTGVRGKTEVHLGDIYYYGKGGIRQDFKTAFMHYNKEVGEWDVNVHAAYKIAEMYERGKGIQQNVEKALEFYELAVKWSDEDGSWDDAQEKVKELSEYLKQQ